MRDPWNKPRGRHVHLTDDEKQFVVERYRAGDRAGCTAKALQCATRTINKYYAFLRNSGGKPTVRDLNGEPWHAPTPLCYTEACLEPREQGSKYCAKHPLKLRPAAIMETSIAPPSRARLMAGR